MDLAKYVSDVRAKNAHATGFPARFDLGKDFVGECHKLYQRGEKSKKELGRTVKIVGSKIELSTKDIVGLPTSITLPQTAGDEFFGDIHCHPSASIGHKDGYAAHSPEDVKSMEGHTSKPIFIRFVCSGSNIYAVVFRKGHSIIDAKKIWNTRDANMQKGRDYFNKMCHVSEDARNDKALELETSEKINNYIHELQRNTPGYGKEMEKLSIEGTTKIASDCKMGFYKGSQGTGWVLYWYETMGMHLQ